MGCINSIVGRVLHLSTKAIINSGDFESKILARHTSPSILDFRSSSPFFDAIQVQDMEAIPTIPDRLVKLNKLAAD